MSRQPGDTLAQQGERVLTKLRPGMERHLLIFLHREQPVVRTIPTSVLGIGVRIIWQSTDALVTTDSGQITAVRMDDVVDFLLYASAFRKRVCRLTRLVVSQFDTGYHDDPSVSSIPIVICARKLESSR